MRYTYNTINYVYTMSLVQSDTRLVVPPQTWQKQYTNILWRDVPKAKSQIFSKNFYQNP